MKNKIKVFVITALLLLSISKLYSVDFSLGFHFPLAGAVIFQDRENKLIYAMPYINMLIPVFNPVKLSFLSEFNDIFSIETSLGYALTLYFFYNTISLQAMPRITKKFNIFSMYAAAGISLKYGFNPISPIGRQENQGKTSNSFGMDAAFAVGFEWKVKIRHFLGIRTEYNLAIPIKKEHILSNLDLFSINFTYRYAFLK